MSTNHAVVMGASITGLVAARVLSRHFDRVSIIDRDVLPAGCENRRGVPQGRHGHGLLASGFDALKQLFPQLERDLVAAGAQRGDVIGNVRWFQHGHYKAKSTTPTPVLLLSGNHSFDLVNNRVQGLTIGIQVFCPSLIMGNVIGGATPLITTPSAGTCTIEHNTVNPF